MITPAYLATATERVLPKLALDFTTGTLDPRVTLTRALNTATRVNASGFIEVINANLPRFDYDPISLAPKGLLIEETRTNNLLESQTLSVGATWSPSNASISANAINGPDGLLTADTLVEDTSTAEHAVLQNIGYVANDTVTLSVFAKTNGRNLRVLMSDNLTGVCYSFFNLTTGIPIPGTAVTTGAWTNVVATTQNYGNGWYRCILTCTKNAGSILTPVLTLSDNSGTSYTGDGSSGAYLWGTQIETGAFPTSYIPTTTTSLTRNADVVSMTGTNFSDWYNSTGSAMLARSRQSVITGTRPSIYISDGTANNIISLRGLAANPELYIKATTDQAQIDAGTLTAESSFGLVGAWATNNCAAAIDGGAAVTDSSATIPTVDQMLIGSDGTNYLNGQIQRISYWPQRLIDAEAQAFSK